MDWKIRIFVDLRGLGLGLASNLGDWGTVGLGLDCQSIPHIQDCATLAWRLCHRLKYVMDKFWTCSCENGTACFCCEGVVIIKFPFYVKCFWHSFNLMDLIPDLDWTVESSKCWIGSRNGLLIARTGLTQNIWTGFWTVPNYGGTK